MAEQKQLITWPVGIGIFYGVFVLLLIIFIIFSGFQSVDLVTKDYYNQELEYQQQIDRIHRTNSLEHKLQWHYKNTEKIIHLEFPENIEMETISGKIVFFRPSDAKLDKVLTINPDINRTQKIDVSRLQHGMWRLQIFWKINTNDYYDEGHFVIE